MNLRRKVLFVCTQMEAGGVQILASDMLASAKKDGLDAALFFLYKKRGVFDNIPGVYVGLEGRPKNLLDLLKIVSRLYWFTRKFKPSAVVGFAHYSSPLAAFISYICRVPNRIATQTNPPKSHNIFARYIDWLAGSIGLYTGNIAASDSIRSEFSRYPRKYKSALVTIYNGIRDRNSSLTKEEARSQFGLKKDVFLAINCGRLSRQKNQSLLIEIVEKLPDVHLAILGEGELRHDLERDIVEKGLETRVTLLGEVEPSRVVDFLKTGDVFLFPSLYEAFGLAVVEAMMAGLPVVSSNHPALVEVLGEAATLLPPNNVSDWVAAVSSLKLDPALMEQRSKLSAQRARLYNYDDMFANFKSIMFKN